MKSFKSLLGVSVVLSLAAYASANTTILQTLGTGTVSYDSTTGVLSATNIPITATLMGGTNESADFSFSADLDTTGALSVPIFSSIFDDASNIQFSITDGGTNILSGSAATADLVDTNDAFDLTAQNPTFNNGVSFTSDIFPAADKADSLQIAFSGSDDGSGNIATISGGNFDSFTAQLAPASFTADIPAAPLPESAWAGLALLGILGAIEVSTPRFRFR